MKRILFLSMIFLAACSNSPKQPQQAADTTAAAHDTTAAKVNDTTTTADSSSLGSFMIYYHQLITAIDNNDARSFNAFIHPQYGLCILEQSGAMPQMRNGHDISRYKMLTGKTLFDIDKSKLHCELKEESLPTVDCDKDDLWSKSGCFTQQVNTFKDEKIWEYCELKKEEKDIAAKSAATITRTVINTNGFRFYFSQIEGKWYLTFLDLREPCSA